MPNSSAYDAIAKEFEQDIPAERMIPTTGYVKSPLTYSLPIRFAPDTVHALRDFAKHDPRGRSVSTLIREWTEDRLRIELASRAAVEIMQEAVHVTEESAASQTERSSSTEQRIPARAKGVADLLTAGAAGMPDVQLIIAATVAATAALSEIHDRFNAQNSLQDNEALKQVALLRREVELLRRDRQVAGADDLGLAGDGIDPDVRSSDRQVAARRAAAPHRA